MLFLYMSFSMWFSKFNKHGYRYFWLMEMDDDHVECIHKIDDMRSELHVVFQFIFGQIFEFPKIGLRLRILTK